jgi:hypothetical protein
MFEVTQLAFFFKLLPFKIYVVFTVHFDNIQQLNQQMHKGLMNITKKYRAFIGLIVEYDFSVSRRRIMTYCKMGRMCTEMVVACFEIL